MNTQVSIKNFRNFDSEGATFDLAPITILTGCNSAGKSSLAKSILLLQNVLSQVPKISKLDDLKMDFTTTNYNLGRFDKVLNNKAKVGDSITISYRKYSLLLSEYATVTLSFKANKVGFNDGVLDRLTITAENGEPIFSLTKSDNGESIIKNNYPQIRKQFIRYCIGEMYSHVLTGHLPKDVCIDSYAAYLESCLPWVDKCGINLNIPKYHQLFPPITLMDPAEVFPMDILVKGDVPDIAVMKHLIEDSIIHYVDMLPKLEGRSLNELREILRSSLTVKDEDTIAWCHKFIDVMLNDYAKSGYTDFIEWYKFLDWNNNDLNHYWLDMRIGMGVYPKHKPVILNVADREYNSDSYAGYGCFEQIEPKDFYVQGSIDLVYSFFDQFIRCSDEESNNYNIQDWMIDFIFYVVYEMLQVEELKSLEYVNSCRVDVKRLYTFENNADFFTNLILRKREKRHESSFINEWLSKFGIGESLDIVQTEEGTGVHLYINKKNGERQLLADEGYGITQLISVILQVEVAIESSKCYEEPHLNRGMDNYLLCNSSQVTSSRLKEIFAGMNYIQCNAENPNEIFRPQTLIIEEPEIHLHPKYQSMLADMFLDAYKSYNIRFIIETHSEYLIRETQVLVSKMGYKTNVESDKNCPFRTYYVPMDGKPYSMGYRRDGKFAERFGNGFYNESANLTIKML